MHGRDFDLPQTVDGSRVALSLQAHHEKGLQLLVTVLCENKLPPCTQAAEKRSYFSLYMCTSSCLSKAVDLTCLPAVAVAVVAAAVAQKPQGPDGLPAVLMMPQLLL